MKNILKKIKDKNIKYAFSLLENAFRSHRLSAMLRSRKTRCSHTEYRNKVAHSFAFSLAEVMVLLTIVAIMLALSAPIISRPSNTDPKHLLKKGVENNVIVANGNYQVLNVGMKESETTKLVVRSKHNTFKPDGTLKERSESGLFSGILRILNSSENMKRMKVDEKGYSLINGEDELDSSVLFRVEPEGKINLTVAQIDKSKVLRFGKGTNSYTSANSFFMPEDGYIYFNPTGQSAAIATELNDINAYNTEPYSSSNLTNVSSIEYSTENSDTTPPVYESIEKYKSTNYRPTILPNMVYTNKSGKLRVIPIRQYPMLIPVSKNIKANCYGYSTNDQWKCGFLPLAQNVNVNEQKSGSQIVFYNDSSSCQIDDNGCFK